MPTTTVPTGIEIWYEELGDADGEPLLLVMGLGAQAIAWDDGFCQALVDRGFRVVRFDNRDVGLSSKVDAERFDLMETMAKVMAGEDVAVPYTLSDMAADAAGLLDHLGIDAAHVVGASMGGMIAQTIAIEHPTRVKSLTSIMSMTGNPEVGQPTPEALAVLLKPAASTRDEAIANSVEASRTISGPVWFDEDVARAKAERSYDRCFNPAGIGRQLLAIRASGDRTEALGRLDVPTVVIHGTVDPLVTPSGGEATAAAIPGAELVLIDDMGHDLPPTIWPQVVEPIVKLAQRANEAAA